MRTRTHYIPLETTSAGMMLGAPVNVVTHGVMRFSLPAGHELTDDNLRQLTIHRAEYVFVSEPDTRSEATVAEDAALAAHRVMQIFENADLGDATTAALFDQVLAFRSA